MSIPSTHSSTEPFRAEIIRMRDLYPAHYVFALLDPHRPVDADHPLHLSQLRLLEPACEIQIVLRPDLDYLPNICPHLITLSKPIDAKPIPEGLPEALAEQAYEDAQQLDGAYVCGVLASSQPALETAQHLAQSLVVRLSAESAPHVLPLFEPMRLEALVRTTPLVWLNAWLGPIVAWHFLDATGHIRQHSRARFFAETKAPKWPVLPLESAQAQQRVPLLARLLHALREREILTQDATLQADAQLKLAAQHKLLSVEDQLFFALNGLTLPPRWAQHPSANAAIQRAAQAECSLAKAFDQFDARTLNEIIRPQA